MSITTTETVAPNIWRISFTRPTIKIDTSDFQDGDIRTVPELVDFNAKFNPTHTFALQAQKANSGSDLNFLNVNYDMLHRSVLRCQEWFVKTISELQLPEEDHNRNLKKGAPIAFCMESNIGMIIHILALMGLGVPVAILSPRLSPAAFKHVIDKTGARAILATPRLRSLPEETLELWDNLDENRNDDTVNGDRDSAQENGCIPRPALYSSLTYEEFLNAKSPLNVASDSKISHPNHFLSETDREVLIFHSSGTTALPKPIYASHRHYLGFTQCQEFENEEERMSITLSTAPLFHVRSRLSRVKCFFLFSYSLNLHS